MIRYLLLKNIIFADWNPAEGKAGTADLLGYVWTRVLWQQVQCKFDVVPTDKKNVASAQWLFILLSSFSEHWAALFSAIYSPLIVSLLE